MEVNVGGGKIPDGAGGTVAVVTSGVGEQVVEVDDAVVSLHDSTCAIRSVRLT